MRTNSIFIAHVAEAIGSPLGGGRGRRSGFPRVYPLAQCGTRPNGLGNSHGRTEHTRPEHQQERPVWQGRSRASAADEPATCGSVSAFAVAVLWCPW